MFPDSLILFVMQLVSLLFLRNKEILENFPWHWEEESKGTMVLSTKYFNCVHEEPRQSRGMGGWWVIQLNQRFQTWYKCWVLCVTVYEKTVGRNILYILNTFYSLHCQGHSVPVYVYLISRLCFVFVWVCVFYNNQKRHVLIKSTGPCFHSVLQGGSS